MDKVFKEIVSTVFKEKFKPYGWKKDGNNFKMCIRDRLWIQTESVCATGSAESIRDDERWA